MLTEFQVANIKAIPDADLLKECITAIRKEEIRNAELNQRKPK